MKKFLSLVLALVMTMSLVTISAGAKDFTDDADINYDDAVAVVSAAGIVSGYENGAFNPQGALTRGAAAKIICNMILGPTTAEALSTTDAPFKDVAADHVFAGYISYCVAEGIVSGYADGTFKPAAPLTGYAFWKMLLGALGYDADIEGYNQSNWSVQVAKRGLNIGLDDGLEGSFTGTKALNREEACLYAFNALQADMVEYDGKSTITIGDIVIAENSEAKKVTDDAAADDIWDEEADGDDLVLQFAEKYFSDLDVEEEPDAYGRPGYEWFWDGESIGVFGDEADEVIVVADKNMTIYDVLTDEDYLDYDVDDSDEIEDITDDVTFTVNGDEAEDDIDTAVARGDIIEVFENSDDEIEAVVVIHTTIAKIDDIDDTISTSDEKKGATCEIELVDPINADAAINTYFDAHDDDDELVLEGYDAEEYVEEAYIAVILNEDGEVLDSYIPEVVTGKVESYKTNDYVIIDGEKYKFAGIEGDEYDFDEEYDVYLSEEGYVIYVDGDTGATIEDMYYVDAVYKTAATMGKAKYFAQAVNVEGEIVQIRLENADEANALAALAAEGEETVEVTNTNTYYAVKALAILTDDENDDLDYDGNDDKYNVVTICEIDGNYDGYVVVDDNDLGDDVAKDDSKIYVGDNKWYVNDETVYIAMDDSGDDLAVSTAVGGMKCSDVNEDGAATRAIVVVDEDAEKTAVFVLFVSDDLSASVASDEIVYLAKTSTQTNKYGYIATLWNMEGNSDETVTVDDADTTGFYKYDIDEDDVYELKSASDDEVEEEIDEDVTGYIVDVEFSDDNLYNEKLDGFGYFDDTAFASDVKVIDVRDEDTEIETSEIYDKEITTLSKLFTAAEKAADAETVLVVDMYVTDGEITFVCVKAIDGEQA